MLLTEAKATECWCPFARVAFVGDTVMNRVSTFHQQLAQKQADRGDDRDLKYYQQQERDTHCVGSRCMAWRWAGYRPVSSLTTPNQDEAHGYCGLAGMPTGTTV
jgi:hypothetical protein